MSTSLAPIKANAYAFYARLRAEAPVHSVKLPSGPVAWLVSRYDDVVALLKDPRLAKDQRNAQGSRPFSRLPGMLKFLQAIERNMLDVDAPDHTRLRGLVHLAFTPRLVERMRARLEATRTHTSRSLRTPISSVWRRRCAFPSTKRDRVLWSR